MVPIQTNRLNGSLSLEEGKKLEGVHIWHFECFNVNRPLDHHRHDITTVSLLTFTAQNVWPDLTNVCKAPPGIGRICEYEKGLLPGCPLQISPVKHDRFWTWALSSRHARILKSRIMYALTWRAEDLSMEWFTVNVTGETGDKQEFSQLYAGSILALCWEKLYFPIFSSFMLAKFLLYAWKTLV